MSWGAFRLFQDDALVPLSRAAGVTMPSFLELYRQCFHGVMPEGEGVGLDKVEAGERVGQDPGGAEDGEIESEFCPIELDFVIGEQHADVDEEGKGREVLRRRREALRASDGLRVDRSAAWCNVWGEG